MDFNVFNSVAAAEKGAALHLKHPATLELLYDNPKGPTVANDKPCVVMVLGAEAPSVRAASRAIQKARATSKPEDAKEGAEGDKLVSLDEIHDQMAETLAGRVTGFKNLRNGERPATKKDVDWFFSLNRLNAQEGEKSFVEQVGDFSSKRGNYLGNVSAD